MDMYVDLCRSFGLPVWMSSLLHAAKRLRTDPSRRRRAYRLLHRKLVFQGVGLKEESPCRTTFVYPEQVKMLMRSAFPEDVCDYPDPSHDQVVYVSMEDLHNVSAS